LIWDIGNLVPLLPSTVSLSFTVKVQKEPLATIKTSQRHLPIPRSEYDPVERYPRSISLTSYYLHLTVMSAAPASGAAPAAKAAATDKNAEPTKDTKPAAALEEDDEFEDFPVESMLPCASLVACWECTSSWQAEI
jgi:hypothetical protein